MQGFTQKNAPEDAFLGQAAFGLQRLPLLGSYFFKQPDIVKRATEGRQHKGLLR